jgi:VCBS repeat-containing protein
MFRQAPSPEETVSCNVVPLLDVMFLLLIFLMLGSDMSVRENADVALASASEAHEPKDRPPGRLVTLNVVKKDGDWTYQMVDRQYDADALPARLAAVATDELERAPTDGKLLSAVTLSIRCDKDAPYSFVQNALSACASAGIWKTEVAAARPEMESN